MKNFSTLIKYVAAKPLNTCMFIIVLMLSLGLSTAQAKDRINYFHSDISGSPIAATNDSGEVLWEETYKPYGERLNTDNSNKTNNNQWYTGKQEEADLGLQYFGARWYHQASGRFISRDPAGVLAHVEDNPMMFNRYAYGNNNPYKYVDPDGRNPVLIAIRATLVATVVFGKTNIIKGINYLKSALKKDGLQTGQRDVTKKAASIKDQAQDLKKLNNNRNTVKVRSGDKITQYDLDGATHKGVETPHKQYHRQNTNSKGETFFNKDRKTVDPMNQQDIRTVREVLKRRNQ